MRSSKKIGTLTLVLAMLICVSNVNAGTRVTSGPLTASSSPTPVPKDNGLVLCHQNLAGLAFGQAILVLLKGRLATIQTGTTPLIPAFALSLPKELETKTESKADNFAFIANIADPAPQPNCFKAILDPNSKTLKVAGGL